MRFVLRGFVFIWLLTGLVACDSKQESANVEEQRYYFLEALRQVESGGRKLQLADISQVQMSEALSNLDDGLKLAFQVERSFLDEIDLRLGKNFERYFIKGVENYRIGIEAADKSQQMAGLQLLQQWSRFWLTAQSTILAQLNPE
jgi:hypothetical protein